MTHTHYIATPISEPPKGKSKRYHTIQSGVLSSSFWYGDDSPRKGEWSSKTVTHWLKPCTGTGAVGEFGYAETIAEIMDRHDVSCPLETPACKTECDAVITNEVTGFAEWTQLSGWKLTDCTGQENLWQNVLKGSPVKKTTSELLEIFKAETQKTPC